MRSHKLSDWVGALQASRGMRRNGIAALAGVMATLALPPVYALPFIIPAFSILLILLHSAFTLRRAFADGWWFGVGFFVTNLYWVTISLFVEISEFWWLVPFALLGLPVCLAIYLGLMGILYKWFNPRGAASLFAIAVLWGIAELARGHWFTGFPWNLIGYVWVFCTPAIQIASVIGSYGLSYLTVLLAAAPALLLLYPEKRMAYGKLLGIIVAAWFGIIYWGAVRLDSHPTEYTDTTVRIVQANIQQTLKWDPAQREKNLQAHIDLSKFTSEPVDVVIWPETAFPFFMSPEDDDSAFWKKNIPAGTTLLTGTVRIQREAEGGKIFNSLIAIEHDGTKPATYDKNHLVPFGEYVPFRKFLPLPKITQGTTDFSTGDGYNVVSLKNIPPFAGLICYETIFPEKAVLVKDGSAKPQWLLNITNDAWFGVSSGPYQHLEMAHMRAVEQGLPLVRAANTGISALFDPYGRIILKLSLEKRDSITHLLPMALPEPTIYSLYFNGLIYIVFLLTVFYLLIRRVFGE